MTKTIYNIIFSCQNSALFFSVQIWGSKVYNEQVNDEPGNYGAGFLGLRLGWAGGLLDTQKSEAMMVGMTFFMCDLCLKNYVSFLG